MIHELPVEDAMRAKTLLRAPAQSYRPESPPPEGLQAAPSFRDALAAFTTKCAAKECSNNATIVRIVETQLTAALRAERRPKQESKA